MLFVIALGAIVFFAGGRFWARLIRQRDNLDRRARQHRKNNNH